MAEFIVDYPDDLVAEGYVTNCINVHERIVRCKECKKQLPKGWRFDKYCNKAEQDACNLFSSHDFDWDYTSFFYVEPNDFCCWGEPRKDD